MKNIILLILTVLLLGTACSKTKLSNKECENLKEALITKNDETLTSILNDLCRGLQPRPTSTDALGHEQNVNTLITRLETNCVITAELVCYACIKTLPAETEIRITITTNNATDVLIIDIASPESSVLRYESIHE